MLTSADCDDILVTVAHPWGDIETTLSVWIEQVRALVRSSPFTSARRRNGDPVPLDAIPLQYRNNPESRRLQTWPASIAVGTAPTTNHLAEVKDRRDPGNLFAYCGLISDSGQ